MALVSAVQGGLRPSQEIQWRQADGALLSLSGATLSGTLRNRATGAKRNVAGALSVTDAAAGKFLWDYAAADVAEVGVFDVEFVAAFGAAPTPAKTYVAQWSVLESLSAPA